MLKLAKLSILAAAVVSTTAATRPAPVRPLLVAPLAIIEAGTVSARLQPVKPRTGKVVVLRREGEGKVAVQPKPAARQRAIPVERREARPAPVRSCACSSGGPPADVMELRDAETALRVFVLGPDGLTRTRYVPRDPDVARQAHDG